MGPQILAQMILQVELENSQDTIFILTLVLLRLMDFHLSSKGICQDTSNNLIFLLLMKHTEEKSIVSSMDGVLLTIQELQWSKRILVIPPETGSSISKITTHPKCRS